MRVDVEKVRENNEFRRKVNGVPLDDIVWCENGVPLEIDDETIRAFEFTGLNNFDFLRHAIEAPESCSIITAKKER